MSPAIQTPPFNTPLTGRDGKIHDLWSRWVTKTQQVVTTGTAPVDAEYWVATANASLTAERNLGGLSSGYVKATVAAGTAVPSTTATIPATDLSGTIPTANFPDPLPALSGVNLTSLTAGNLIGSLPAISGAALTALPNPLPAVSGANLTALNASNLSSGTVPQARLPFVLDADVYTPTLTNVANLDGSTAYSCQYLRVGSVVTVSGQVDLDPTTTLTDTQLGISLPIASNFANANECAGSGSAPAIAAMTVAILGDVANNRATLQFKATDVTNQPVFFSFIYRVI